MTQLHRAYVIVASSPEGMTPEQLAPLMGISVSRSRCVMSRIADYFGLERVRAPLPRKKWRTVQNRKWRMVYRLPRAG